MKTIVLKMKTTAKAAIFCALCVFTQFSASSQTLVFTNPVLQTAPSTNLNKGAIYLFNNVAPNVKATVRIDTLVGGAKVNKIDDNSNNLGYSNAFQPEIKIPSGLGQAYATFTITFYNATSNTLQSLDSLKATALDIDGNLLMKEFAEIGMNGGLATYASGTLDISVLQMLLNRFKGENILGIERTGIDTAAMGNMFTVRKPNVSSFTIKVGANTVSGGSADRQYSIYMKGFQYPNQITLPVKLESFTAILNNINNKAELKWVTSAEKNVSHFVIEKSTDGKNFNDAGTVFAFGNTTQTMTYAYGDNINTVQSSVFYYRLRMVDADGRTEYSQTRIIRISKQNTTTVTILTYPNPATNELRVTIPANWQGKKVAYEIVNASAQAVKKINTGSASQTETLDVSKLAPGLYVVNVSCGNETAQQKIVKK
jgi:hypothetical protein